MKKFIIPILILAAMAVPLLPLLPGEPPSSSRPVPVEIEVRTVEAEKPRAPRTVGTLDEAERICERAQAGEFHEPRTFKIHARREGNDHYCGMWSE